MYPRDAAGPAAATATATPMPGPAPAPVPGSNYSDGTDGYEVKRQRLLHSSAEGATAASSMHGSYYYPNSTSTTSSLSSSLNPYVSNSNYPPAVSSSMLSSNLSSFPNSNFPSSLSSGFFQSVPSSGFSSSQSASGYSSASGFPSSHPGFPPSHSASGFPASHAASNLPTPQSTSGFPTSHPSSGYASSHSASGLASSHPASGYTSSQPAASGYPSSHSAGGSLSSHSASGLVSSHAASGLSSSHGPSALSSQSASGLSSSHSASGFSSSLPSSKSSFLSASPPHPPANTNIPQSLNSSSFVAGSPPPPFDHHFSPFMPLDYPSLESLLFRGPRFPFFGQARSFPVVRLRGLPFNCTEVDIYEFFAGLDVVDVLLTHKQGRFSGEAYCVFSTPIQVDFALQRNKKNIGQRYIEVFRSKKQDYYSAIAVEVTESNTQLAGEFPASLPPPKPSSDKDKLPHTGVLKLRGLPFSASKRDIKEFFKGYDLKDEAITFVVHSDGRATGEAFVEFEGANQSKHAMCRDKMMLGSRYVELFPSTQEEAARAAARQKNSNSE